MPSGIVTKRLTLTSAVAQILFSSFSTLGTSTSAVPGDPVEVYMANLSNRFFVGGSSAVSTANGYLITSAGTTHIHFRAGEELWGITSAAVNTTASFLFTNQPC